MAEAITRCRYFMSGGSSVPPAYRLVEAIASESAFPTVRADAFWRLKNAVYTTVIHSRVGLVADAIAQAYMRENLHRFSPHYAAHAGGCGLTH